MKNYIGLSTSANDPSIAIIDPKGELVFAEAAERRLQSKRAWGIQPDHVQFIEELVEQYCDPDADTVVSMTWPKSIPNWLTYFALPILNIRLRRARPNERKWLLDYRYQLFAHRSVLKTALAGVELAFARGKARIEPKYYRHHLTHAALAAYASPYDEGVCVVTDGMGEDTSTSAYVYRNGKLGKIKGVKSFPASLGGYYSFVTDVCGFDSMKGEEWKVMGLAAYGKVDEKLYALIRPLIGVDGLQLKEGRESAKSYRALHDMRRKRDVPALTYADFAATAQFVFTETLHQLLRNIHALGYSDNLILSGGCALNSSANGTIVEHTPFKEVFVSSAPADDGNSVGAAFRAFYADHPYVRRDDGVLSPYLGSSMKSSSFTRLKKYCGFRSEELDDETLVFAVARALAEGKLVGWVQGRAEFGPRALGNRSILADPRSMGVKERINAEVKFREEFRPFAPSILHEYGDEYFEHYQFSPYMERTLRYKESVKAKVPGVVHVDGTGRLQSVTRKISPRYYDLIKTFCDLTGVPVLLNTSFNVMGKPIIHSVEDAVGVFQTSGLDLLVIENTVFVKDQEYQLSSGTVRSEKTVVVQGSFA
jgi:carbamoyltransferase